MDQKGKNAVQFVGNPAEKKVDVLIGGDLFTSYIYPDNIAKPTLYPLITSTGKRLTRGFPLDPQPGERFDHPHHVGFWLNYGDVNGYDFWNNSFSEPDNHKFGVIRHEKVVRGDGKKGLLEVTAKWVSGDQEDLLAETTQFYFSASGNTRQIDRITTLKALTDVAFNDNKEGLIGIRVIRALELPSDSPEFYLGADGKPMKEKTVNNDGVTGNYLSSEGLTGGGVWGTRGKWMYLYGRVDGDPVSLTLIDHPSNVGYPTYWHARGYGLFAANPLGQKIFSEGREELNFSLKKGESVTFRYRLLVQGGNGLSKQEIDRSFEEFSKK